MLTIDKLYKMSKEDPENKYPLLTDYQSSQAVDWWDFYVENFEAFDYQFKQMYKSFVFFDQDPEDTDAEIMEKFGMTVYSWLMMNDKRYSELYRIHVIPDDENYVLTDNYNMNETYSGSNTGAAAQTTGQRTDVNIDNIGSQNSANQNGIAGWNSSTQNALDSSNSAIGTRQDTNQFTKGEETDTTQTEGTDEHTVRRWGNIGVQSVMDQLTKQEKFWQTFNFYKIVFEDICKNFLLIGRDVNLWH